MVLLKKEHSLSIQETNSDSTMVITILRLGYARNV